MPFDQYRLRPVEVLHQDERRLELAETRVAAGRLLNAEWASDELGVIVAKVRLLVADGILKKSLEGSIVVSGHALGRRFERVRAADRTHDRVIADIDALIGVKENVLGWRAVDFMANDYGTPRKMRDVRTWLWHPD